MTLLTALKRPFTSARTLLGLLLSAIPLVGFFAMGYKMASAAAAMRGDYSMPKWAEWKNLFLYGAGARALQAICIAPAAIVYWLMWIKIRDIQILAQNTTQMQEFVQASFAIKNLFPIFVILLFMASILMPALILNYISSAKFSAAFSAKTFSRLFSREYFKAWVISAAYVVMLIIFFFLVIFFSAGVINAHFAAASPLILLFEISLIWFPGVTIWTLFGEAWGKILQKEAIEQQKEMQF